MLQHLFNDGCQFTPICSWYRCLCYRHCRLTLHLTRLFAQGLLQVATAALLSKAALAVTYALSGIPQLAETVSAAVSGKIDTHVLMSLSIVGTLYMGMAQEVRVPSWLFAFSDCHAWPWCLLDMYLTFGEAT